MLSVKKGSEMIRLPLGKEILVENVVSAVGRQRPGGRNGKGKKKLVGL